MSCISETIKSYTIGGVPVQFPFRAYPSQIIMMDRIIKCLNKKQNCLLESPTGTGKSLALLCAALGWQKKIKKEITEMELKLEAELSAHGVSVPDVNPSKSNQCSTGCGSCASENYSIMHEEKKLDAVVTKVKNQAAENSKRGIIYIDDMEDFVPAKKFRPSLDSSVPDLPEENSAKAACCSKMHVPAKEESVAQNMPEAAKVNKNCDANNTIPNKLPKIYFGTRTHKQIEQIIRELKRTPYKNAKMTVLASRDKSCINLEVKNSDNVNEACEELMKSEGGPACRFYRPSKVVSHFHPPRLSLAFDLTDLVKACNQVRACPYFSARELMLASEIVFCPYNYLTDPLIRTAMNIQLKGNIVIMDEAHNIEDSARDAASCKLTLSQLESSVLDLEKVSRLSKSIPQCYSQIAKTASKLVSWVKGNSGNLSQYTSFNSSARVWLGDEMIAILNLAEIGPEHFSSFQKTFEKILAEETDSDKESEGGPIDMDKPKLLGSTLIIFKNLVQILSYLYKNNLIFVPDYRLAITKTKVMGSHSTNRLMSSPFEISINFWCMNPAVAFSDMKDIIHSVIVASGTLSPLTSFQSELGLPFPITLEANHVIAKEQVWVGTISKGPNNSCLNGSFHNAGTFSFQDDIGEVVLNICSVIPHGVLCFLPSYHLLENLVKRWQHTLLWDKLSEKKIVLSEPRRQNDFNTVITEFYNAVKMSEQQGTDINGALLLAVCRGKVSEGLDFADNNARAVITVGIPFPNIKDAQVDLKKKYNDMHSSKKQIMRGSEWYDVQAFRALNQALGRCIRHQKDFGALVIIDERFQKYNHYPKGLSKWVRQEIQHFGNFSEAFNSLKNFALKKFPEEVEELIV